MNKIQIKILSLTFIVLLSSINVSAQLAFDVTGTITDPKSRPIESASVFIDGSQKITTTNEHGNMG